MRIPHLSRCGVVGFCAVLAFALSSSAKDEPNRELVQMVVNLLSEKDKDLRAVGLDQVRNEAKGTAATKQFAAQLPKLNAAEQVGLLECAGRSWRPAALPAVIELLANQRRRNGSRRRRHDNWIIGRFDRTCRSCSNRLPMAAPPKKPRRESSDRTTSRRGRAWRNCRSAQDFAAADSHCAHRNSGRPPRPNNGDDILTAANGDDAKVRGAAMAALSQLASAEHLPGMFDAVLKAENGPSATLPKKRSPWLPDASTMPTTGLARFCQPGQSSTLRIRIALLPTLGRVGGERFTPS